MDHHLRLSTLFKILLLTYILTLVIIVHKINDDPMNQAMAAGERELAILRNRSTQVRNVTKYVYLNRTQIEVVYQDKVVYKDKLIYTARPVSNYGPGENGSEVLFNNGILPREEVEVLEENRKQHGFNTFVSDEISLQRTLRDMRPKACIDMVYPKDLPAASVVVIFRDEWHSILLRTAYSVLKNSPPNLLKEVILVDDGSTNLDLIAKVKIHVDAVEKFRLIQNPKPLGLMMAREKGIEATRSDYFIVMDGHMEVNVGWLEPLLYRLVQEPNALLCSHVGAIKQDTLEYVIDDPKMTDTMFDKVFPFFDHLTLDQMWVDFSNEYRQKRNGSVEPVEYGTIQGMMTVMRKEFFMQLGGFDPGMKVWGSEQIDLSVKVWLCGGKVEMVPCSKVAHMYRITPWGGFNASFDFHSINKYRMSEVWMDGFQLEIMRDFLRKKKFNAGSIEERREIRRRNNCKSYQYYIEKVRSFSSVYIPDETITAMGSIYNELVDRCMDCAKINESYKIILYPCNDGGNQYFIHTNTAQIRSTQATILNVNYNANNTLEIIQSPGILNRVSTVFWYLKDDTIRHDKTGLCLNAANQDVVDLRQCDGTYKQKWKWQRHKRARRKDDEDLLV